MRSSPAADPVAAGALRDPRGAVVGDDRLREHAIDAGERAAGHQATIVIERQALMGHIPDRGRAFVTADRRLEPGRHRTFSYLVFSTDDDTLTAIQELRLRFFREMRALVAASPKNTRVAVANVHLFAIDVGKPDRTSPARRSGERVDATGAGSPRPITPR
jgi:hypothetical protein